jgi:hypothetical protein
MWKNKIILLLSNHRQPSNQIRPLALTKHQIVSLIGSSLPPNQPQDNLANEIQDVLNELEAEGEILAGTRNRYCMAPPTVLAKNQEDLLGLLFRGDRAYLTLAHQAIESQKNPENPLLLRPKSKQFDRIKNRLSQVGVRLLTVSESIEYLPKPKKPLKSELRLPWSYDPFSIKNWLNKGYIERYNPCDAPQKDRWRNPSRESIKNEDILRLPTGEYLWFEGEVFYELEPDVAVLTMFCLDAQMRCPLKIDWDEPPGRLNLQGVVLPSTYARWFWRLSEPDLEQYRTRNFQSKNWSLVKEAFEHLGAKLV